MPTSRQSKEAAVGSTTQHAEPAGRCRQAVILLLFNEKDAYVFSEIQEAISLPPDEVKRYLTIAHAANMGCPSNCWP